MDDNFFADDWLREHYYNITRALSEEKNIVVTEEGIDISGANNLHLVEDEMSKYIDWMYGEYEKYKRGEKPWESYLKTMKHNIHYILLCSNQLTFPASLLYRSTLFNYRKILSGSNS